MSTTLASAPRAERPAELDAPGLVLLFGHLPNGWKVTYLLEHLKHAGLIPEYTVLEVYLQGGQDGEQFKPWFKELNPNCACSPSSLGTFGRTASGASPA